MTYISEMGILPYLWAGIFIGLLIKEIFDLMTHNKIISRLEYLEKEVKYNGRQNNRRDE